MGKVKQNKATANVVKPKVLPKKGGVSKNLRSKSIVVQTVQNECDQLVNTKSVRKINT